MVQYKNNLWFVLCVERCVKNVPHLLLKCAQVVELRINNIKAYR